MLLLHESPNCDMWYYMLFMIADDNDARKQDDSEKIDVDKELEASFNAWKSKTYALTVPLKVVALRGSVPPSWIKVCHTHSLSNL